MLVVYVFWAVLVILGLVGAFPTTGFGRPIYKRPHHWYFTYSAGIMLGLFLLLAGVSARGHGKYIVVPLGALLVVAHSIAAFVRLNGRCTVTRRSLLACTVGQSLFVLLLMRWIGDHTSAYTSVVYGLSVTTIVGVMCTRLRCLCTGAPFEAQYLGV